MRAQTLRARESTSHSGSVLKSLAITVYICRSRQVNDLPGFSFFFFFVLSASLTPRRSAASLSSIYSGNSQISSFSLTREKRERKKQDGVFKDVLVAKDFVASRRAGPTRTKILKRDNTTTNSRFMIDLVAEMLFEKTAWCFCAARMLVKNGPNCLWSV